MEKEKLYQKISQEILENIGGPQNIQGGSLRWKRFYLLFFAFF